ncbi:formimidoylglutamase [Albibacterium bauzanense]|uniref:Arginase family enzyme n=1 Tax=Albibacterium bauzanense TaxID=653929 RepID=A0A4R1LZG6_9SPHI|nr:formimidoylglutamase [Albibacterium bauzanense]TCK82763.1 arginase family enzyme [Albibacterium bauzanense]
MSLIDFFTPVNVQEIKKEAGFLNSQLGSIITIYEQEFPDLEGVDIAIFGVADDRKAVNNKGCASAADAFRKKFYQLHQGEHKINVVDLGNIQKGFQVTDTYAAVKTVVTELVKSNILPIIIGGGQDLTYAQYMAYEKLEQRVDLVLIDPAFDLEEDSSEESDTTSRSYLNKIMLHQPNYLFNFSNIGYQSYFVNTESLKVLDKLLFDVYRLGTFSGKIEQAEPILRNADMISFDMGAIRSSNAFANANAGPNGFYGEEACQMCRYAGMSDKLTSIGFYEFNPDLDQNGQTAILLSQMIWYFIDGYYGRKKDFPLQPKSAYVIYRTSLTADEHEVVFVKSKKSDRWWMQVPYPNTKSVNERYHMVPCRYEDYQIAIDGELPDLWWRTYQKLI